MPEPTPIENSNLFLQKQKSNMQSLNTINYFDNFEPDYYTEIQLFYETISETIPEPITESI